MIGLVIGVHSTANAAGDSGGSVVGSVVDSGVGGVVDDLVGDQKGTHRVVFDDGFELIVIEDESAAENPVQMWLIVRAGSMYERDEQRGAAMVLERIIRRGTARFEAHEIDELLINRSNENNIESGSFVSFDQAGYLAEVDGDNREQMERVLGFFDDVVGIDPDLVSDEQVERAIGDVRDEIRDEPSAELRSRQRWLPVLMRGTLFGDRLPWARVDELDSLSAAQVRNFARAQYRPSRAVLVVYGDVDAQAIERLVSLHNEQASRDVRVPVDARMGKSVADRYVLGTDAGFTTQQSAMIWFTDRDDRSDGDWSERARRFTLADMRTHVIDRVAGEVVRYRLDRLSAEALGLGAQVSVEQVDLFGQVDLVQIAIESSSQSDNAWARSMSYLVSECDRLSRDGASDGEIVRARGALLARWHRAATDWTNQGTQSKMGLMHWLITTGRPIMDMKIWDEKATRLMVDISDDDVQRAVQRLVEPSKAAYLALMSDDVALKNQFLQSDDTSMRNSVIEGVVRFAMGSPLEQIDPEWTEKIAGPLFDPGLLASMNHSVIEEVVDHRGPDVVAVKLRNGTQIWSRRVGDESQDQVHLSATVWGGVLSDQDNNSADFERTVRAAMSAWRMPATESRSSGAVSAFMREHGLTVEVMRETGYVQLGVRGSVDSLSEAAQLMYVLLDQPMIEREAFASWEEAYARDGIEPIELALGKMYNNAANGQAHGEHKSAKITLDDAQRMLTQIVRSGRIDIGIAGPMNAPDMVERVSKYFGLLVERDRVESLSKTVEERPFGMTNRRLAQLSGIEQRERGVTVGFVSDKHLDLASLRGLFLGVMVLNDRIGQLKDERGVEFSIRANVGFSDAIAGRAMLLVRGWCDESELETVSELIEDAIELVVRDGIDADELSSVQDRIDRSILEYFDTPTYWSARLSMLGVHDRSVDDLWTIREGYRVIDHELVSRVFGEMVSSRDQFRVELSR